MDSYDWGEMCELIGIYIQSKLTVIFDKNDSGGILRLWVDNLTKASDRKIDLTKKICY